MSEREREKETLLLSPPSSYWSSTHARTTHTTTHVQKKVAHIWRLRESKTANPKMLHDGWNLTIKSIYFVLKSFISDLSVCLCVLSTVVRLNWIEFIRTLTYSHACMGTNHVTIVHSVDSPSMSTVSIHLSTRTLILSLTVGLLVPSRVRSLSDRRSNRLSNTPNNVHHLKHWCNRTAVCLCVCMLLEQVAAIMHSLNR